MQQKKLHVNEISSTLELPKDVWKLDEQMSVDQAQIVLDEFKALVKKQHKVLVKKYHPDLPGNGEKEETKMKEVNAMIDVIMNLKITLLKPKTPKIIQDFEAHFRPFNRDETPSHASDSFTFRFRF